MTSSAPVESHADSVPVVLLVHGAFADNSIWRHVIALLQENGIEAIAIANPLRGLAADARYLANAARQFDRPVVLVGHCYGGAVISNLSDLNNVESIVFIAGIALDQGESKLELLGQYPESQVGPALAPSSYPNGHEHEAVEMYLARDRFQTVYCSDLPDDDARVLAALQRPIALAALEERSGAPFWREMPTWYLVAANDEVVPPAAQRHFASRMKSAAREVEASHAVPLTRPDDVVEMIKEAVHSRV